MVQREYFNVTISLNGCYGIITIRLSKGYQLGQKVRITVEAFRKNGTINTKVGSQ